MREERDIIVSTEIRSDDFESRECVVLTQHTSFFSGSLEECLFSTVQHPRSVDGVTRDIIISFLSYQPVSRVNSKFVNDKW